MCDFCVTCGGSGEVLKNQNYRDDQYDYRLVICPACRGHGFDKYKPEIKSETIERSMDIAVEAINREFDKREKEREKK